MHIDTVELLFKRCKTILHGSNGFVTVLPGSLLLFIWIFLGKNNAATASVSYCIKIVTKMNLIEKYMCMFCCLSMLVNVHFMC